jgi:hypothetical protein
MHLIIVSEACGHSPDRPFTLLSPLTGCCAKTRAEVCQVVHLAALRTIQAVGHTGHDPVELPFPVGCTTPVLGGPCVSFASNKTAKGSR